SFITSFLASRTVRRRKALFIRIAPKLASLQETILITYDLILEYNKPLYEKCKEVYRIKIYLFSCNQAIAYSAYTADAADNTVSSILNLLL
ncbi:MAG: hypothetical protein Q621_VSBC00353G0003, partial [Veillonella sp. DORA_B_18_19_23]